MKRMVVAVVALSLVFGSLASAQTPRRGGTLRVGLNADPPNLDPHQSTAAVDRQVFQSLFDKLVDTNHDLEIVPMLALSWTISNNGKTYLFLYWPKEYKTMSPKVQGFILIADGMMRFRHVWLNP